MMRSTRVSLWIGATLICMGLGTFSGTASAAPKKALAKPTQATQLNPKKSAADRAIGQECVKCHTDENPALVTEWKKSAHSGKDVDCYDCHKAEEGDKDAYMHHKARIATIVTPKDCASCHEKEVSQQQPSHHAKGGDILASLDNLMGEVIGGPQAVVAGCKQCHGGVVEVETEGKNKGKPTADSWPNTGIGRLNIDGSKGSCSACHARHRFSSAQAREPDTCGKCHLGPDHPQKEVYEESKHGILFNAFRDEMNLKSKSWVVGKDYSAAPTCATCHMSATKDQEVTHNVGDRISWTLRPPISVKLNSVKLENGSEHDVPHTQELPKVGDEFKGSKVKAVVTWDKRRDKMKDVCIACHTERQVEQHYVQFDGVVDLYNDKYAKPIAAMMEELKKAEYITAVPFDEKLEWIWWEIWHHEGRRARHGAAMMGPDYTWWHGIYEVAQNTYFKWIPELKKVVMAKDGNENFANELLKKHFGPIPGHDWYFNGLSKDALEKVRKGFEERYGKGSLK